MPDPPVSQYPSILSIIALQNTLSPFNLSLSTSKEELSKKYQEGIKEIMIGI